MSVRAGQISAAARARAQVGGGSPAGPGGFWRAQPPAGEGGETERPGKKTPGGGGQARDASTQEFAVVGIHSLAPTKCAYDEKYRKPPYVAYAARNVDRH